MLSCAVRTHFLNSLSGKQAKQSPLQLHVQEDVTHGRFPHIVTVPRESWDGTDCWRPLGPVLELTCALFSELLDEVGTWEATCLS